MVVILPVLVVWLEGSSGRNPLLVVGTADSMALAIGSSCVLVVRTARLSGFMVTWSLCHLVSGHTVTLFTIW